MSCRLLSRFQQQIRQNGAYHSIRLHGVTSHKSEILAGMDVKYLQAGKTPDVTVQSSPYRKGLTRLSQVSVLLLRLGLYCLFSPSFKSPAKDLPLSPSPQPPTPPHRPNHKAPFSSPHHPFYSFHLFFVLGSIVLLISSVTFLLKLFFTSLSSPPSHL